MQILVFRVFFYNFPLCFITPFHLRIVSQSVNFLLTVFLLINAPGAMLNIDREPLFCTQFTKQKVCPVVSAVQVF